MKKSIIVVALLLVATQANASFFDNAISFLKKSGSSLFDKGKKLLSDNSDKIWDMVKEKGMPLLTKGVDYAKEKIWSTPSDKTTPTTTPTGTKTVDQASNEILNEAKKVSDAQEKELVAQAQSLAKDKTLTPAEQKMILQEAQALANQNRAALEKQAVETIAQKRESLKRSIYEKYGKGTPTMQ